MPASEAAAPCLSATSGGQYLKATGTSITCAGEPLTLTGFTFYPALLGGSKAWHDPNFPQYIDKVLAMGVAAGQNLIRPTDQWDKHTPGQKADDPVVWANMDYLMKAARKAGVFVVLDLSTFRWLLQSQGQDPWNPSLWTGFIDQVAGRYRDDSAVAFYSIVGEPAPPTSTIELQSLTAFYRTTSDEIRKADPNHLIAAGGFNHMEDHPELGWWQAIDQLPGNDLIGVKTYSQHDVALMPAISAFAVSAGKPVIDEEFGMPQGYGDATFAGGSPYNGLSTGRAPFFQTVYSTGRKLGFAGFVLWNLGCQVGSTSYEVSPLTPAAWQVVAANGARTESGANQADPGSLCPLG